MKSISAYGDYRIFMRDFYDLHRKDARFSWRAMMQRAGLNNPNFLRQVMLGERNLGEKTIGPVGKAFGFEGRELDFWHLLVRSCQAKTESAREKFRRELLQMRGTLQAKQISEGFADYYRHWYTPAVRELVTLYDFKDDFNLLAKSLFPQIRPEEARSAVEVLKRFHFIEKNSAGRFVQTDRAVHSGTPEERSALLRYHTEMVEMAAQSLKLDKERRFVTGMTLGVSKACYQLILAEAEKFKNRVAALVHSDSESDTVMQLALQIFPTGAAPLNEFSPTEDAS